MPTRTKNGRAVATSPPAGREHGRPLAGLAVVRPRAEPRDAAHVLAVASVEKLVALALKDRTRYRNAKRRGERARAEVLQEPDGATQVQRIYDALSSAAPAIRTATRAHVDSRPFAVEAAVTVLQLVREHDVKSTAGLALIGSAAAWLALSSMLRDRAFAVDPSALAVKQSRTKDDVGVTATLPMLGDVLKLGAQASAAARLDLLTALQIERETRQVEPHTLPAADGRVGWTPAMVAAIERRRAQEGTGEALDAADDVRPIPPAEDIPEANVEPPRRARVDERVVSAVEGERQDRAASAVGRVLVADGVIGPAGSGDALSPPARRGLCPHGTNPRACPTCAMAAQQAQLVENRRRIKEERR